MREKPSVKELEGDWKVERRGGLLPPMPGVWKRIRGEWGTTRAGMLPGVPFRVEEREGALALVYRPPLGSFVDEIQPQPDGSWAGRATVAGREFGRFRMSRV